MDLADYPSCCTVEVLYGMGRTLTGDHRSQRNTFWDGDRDMAREILSKMMRAKRQGIAALSCAINSEQVQANRVLKTLGWVPTRWMTKDNHPDTQVRLFHWPTMSVDRDFCYELLDTNLDKYYP